jgi:hypothetical protein
MAAEIVSIRFKFKAQNIRFHVKWVFGMDPRFKDSKIQRFKVMLWAKDRMGLVAFSINHYLKSSGNLCGLKSG